MSHTPQQMRSFRNHRLELILLGMALAKDGDRERIVKSINKENMQSPLVRQCLESLESMQPLDVTIIKDILRNWGVPIGDSLTDSMVASVNLSNSRRLVAEAVALVSVENKETVSSLIEEMQGCIDQLKKTSEGARHAEATTAT